MCSLTEIIIYEMVLRIGGGQKLVFACYLHSRFLVAIFAN